MADRRPVMERNLGGYGSPPMPMLQTPRQQEPEVNR
jgi:hypothetical protein